MNYKNINVFFFGWLIGVTVFIAYQHFNPDIYVMRKYAFDVIFESGYIKGTKATLKAVRNINEKSSEEVFDEIMISKRKDSIIFNHIIEK